MSLVEDFKAFILRGNVVDLAVAVIVGGAFGKIVDGFVNDLVMPPIGLLTGKGFIDNYVVLKPAPDGTATFATLEAAKKGGAVVLAYGNFLTTVLNFLIIGLVVFTMVKLLQKVYKPAEAAPAGPSTTDALLMEIRDALKK